MIREVYVIGSILMIGLSNKLNTNFLTFTTLNELQCITHTLTRSKRLSSETSKSPVRNSV